MGFKRTTEGRVFFQGADETSATGKTVKSPEYRSLTQNGSAQATQFQILTLLKSLNEKLKTGQAERMKMRAELDDYRKLVTDLEGKAQRSERAYLDLEQKLARTDKGAAGKAERAEKLAEDTVKELAETRKLLLELEDKTEKADKGVMTLQRQMGQAKALGDEIVKKQGDFAELAKRIEESEKSHEDLSEKLKETNSQQSKMLRQIEKVAEDRARFMRKIERIEETVIQTRDALSAKAMVLLTEQGANSRSESKPVLAASVAAPSIVDQVRDSAAQSTRTEAGEDWWRKPAALQTAGVAAILVLGVLGGWVVSEVRKAQLPSFEEFQTAEAPPPPALSAEAPEAEDHFSQAAQNDYAPLAPAYTDEQAGPFLSPAEQKAEPLNASDDIGTLDVNDEQKLMQMLEEDPDALAAELNKIEPSDSIQDSVTNSVIASSQPLREIYEGSSPKSAQPASIPEKETVETPAAEKPVTQKPVAAKPARAPASKKELLRMMTPDSALPIAAKEIEAQAYEGVPEAQHDLAAVYTAGHAGVRQDYDRAVFWFRQAADGGIANARYNLGVLYHQGLGVKPDIREAIQWYKAAADIGHPEAQYNLGIAYIEGIGVGYDPQLAASNFEQAAGKGIVEAAYNLGLIYENGLLGKPEPEKALRWYKTAADQGNPEAKEALAQLAKALDIKVEDVNRIAGGDRPVIKAAPQRAAPRTASPEASTETSPRPAADERAIRAQVQEYLIRAGLYPGPADGVETMLTHDAVRSYQSANGIAADGRISNGLLAHMLANEINSGNP